MIATATPPKTMSVIQTRISTDIKNQAEAALSKTGLTLNDLVRISINNFVTGQEIVIKSSTPPRLSDEVRAKVLQSQTEHKKGEFVSFDNTETMDNYFDNL